jgi:MFS family permease
MTHPVVERRRLSEARPPLITPAFLLVTVSTFAYFLSVGAVLPVLPRYVKGPLHGGSFSVGLVVGAFTVTALVLRPLAGRLGDRRGRKLLIVAGAAIVALSVEGYTISKSVPVLVVFRLLTGVGEALFFTGAASAANDLAPESRRGEAVSYFSLALYGGLAFGPFIGEWLLDGGRFRLVWVLAGAASAVAALVGLRVRDVRPKGDAPRGGPLVNRAAVLPGAVLVASTFGFAAFGAFVPLYSLQLGLGGSRFLFLLYAGIILAVRLVGARLPDRFGVRRMAAVSLAGSIAGLVVMGAWAHPAGLYVSTAMLALGQSLMFPALMTMALRAAPAAERGSVVGTFTAFFDLGFGVGAAALGGVAALFGYRGAFLAGALVGAAGLALLFGSEGARPEPSTR